MAGREVWYKPIIGLLIIVFILGGFFYFPKWEDSIRPHYTTYTELLLCVYPAILFCKPYFWLRYSSVIFCGLSVRQFLTFATAVSRASGR